MLNILVLFSSFTVIVRYGVAATTDEPYFEATRTKPVVKFRNAAEAEAAGEQHYVFDFIGLVENHGYPAEEHIVVTEDGYNLRLHRIPGSPSSPTVPGKPAVLLQYGVMGSSDMWVLMGPQSDLPFVLADSGYDVWLGNARGNTYSRSHRNLNPSEPKFWEFSFHEIGAFDLPAMIDYILLETNHKSLHYVGHSMGTTASYVLLSQKPEYNEKVKLVVSLAPVAFWKHRPAGMEVFLRKNAVFIQEILKNVKLFEVFPQTRELAEWARMFCHGQSNPCKLIASQLAGDDFTLINATLLPYIVSYYPAGGSTRTLMHFEQHMQSGKFRRFDEGLYKNLDVYGQMTPPSYDLTKITAPVALIYGMNDPISTRKDSRYLASLLPNVVAWEPVPYAKFNHIDFQWARRTKGLLHSRIIQLMKTYELLS